MKKAMSPPQLPLRFFRWFCHPKLRDSIEGDLMELYKERLIKNGKLKADAHFIKDVLLLFRPGIIRPTEGYQNLNSYGMYKNYFITAWRNVIRKKSSAAINVFGLTLGISCALIIFALVNYHLSFDNFHTDADRIYRFVTEEHRDEVEYDASVPPPFGKFFREDYTFSDQVARLYTGDNELITIERIGEKNKFNETIAFAEPDFFKIFNFPLSTGNPETILVEPNTAIITKKMAAKYFGDESAIGKVIRLNSKIDFTVSGVLQDLPVNSDIQTEIYFSYSTMKQYNEWAASDDAWGGITSSIKTYTKLKPGVNPTDVEQAVDEYVKRFRPKSKNVHHYKLQPLNDVHFNARYEGVMSKTTIWILSLVGVLLVLTASLNFINLTTAQAINRSKEVGVRKSLGGARGQLFWQFTIETGLVVLVATVLALAFSYAILPQLNSFLNTNISINLFTDTRLLLFVLALIVVVTGLSGAYPGIVLSGFKPVLALKGKLSGKQTGSFNIRRALIVTQFSISQILLLGLIVMFFQMRYFSKTDMGFDTDAIIMMPVGSNDEKLKTVKSQLLQVPGVENVSLCFGAPASDNHWTTSIKFDDRAETEPFSISHKGADEDYLSTFSLEIIAGRNLTPSDTVREFLVNENLLSQLNLASPEEILGKNITVNGSWKGPVVGVVKDFHEQSFHADIKPVFLTTSGNTYNSIAVKINMRNANETLTSIEKVWSGMYPDLIYKYDFLDDQIASFYQTEQQMVSIVYIFASIALIIGALGLYGLVSFMAVQKTKEIGIRKVLGGDVVQILWIFGKEFTALVVVAFLIAAPVGWLVMTEWLSNYAFKVDISLWMFALELFIIALVVLVTVGYRSLKAVVANPVESLRSE
ncbi:MAG: ABC transporter permease [Cytophagales bacterium]|nr:ABC transporter permease [Cytophagales bacterium]